MKDEIIAELQKVKRDGMSEFITWLIEDTDFFTAPCSSKHHLNRDGGLIEHSWNVFQLLKIKNEQLGLGYDEESIIICGLLHDICKVNFYSKNPRGYSVNDSFPYGHGEKSVYYINKFFKLEDEEAISIRFHMAPYDIAGSTEYSLNDAKKRFKLLTLLQTADLEATFILEA